MMQITDEHVKVLFRFYSSVLDEETVETMWATIVSKKKGLYKIDNIPFYAECATGDIVFAEHDEDEQMLTYRNTVIESGNSTVQVITMHETVDINAVRKVFSNLGCESERLNDRYFAMEIPVKVDYKIIKAELSKLASEEVIDYAEPCLGAGHRYW